MFLQGVVTDLESPINGKKTRVCSLPVTNLEDTVRAQIRVLLKNGVTQKAIAERLEISQPVLNRWLHGEHVRLGMNVLGRFMTYLTELTHIVETAKRALPQPAGSERQPELRPPEALDAPTRRRKRTG